ncbi:hypothetical protein B0H10DRAFT_2356353 [Mycena sp. CBHHK59/15]|nr:hypothetical protein B0H10DRAFT_2356353 [Mycena sp. CBHHK59/15]
MDLLWSRLSTDFLMSVKLLLGPILIGASIASNLKLNTLLYGIWASQFTTYYLLARRLDSEDPKIIRYLVLWESILETFHSAISIYFIWLYLVDNFLNASFLATAPWPITAVPLLATIHTMTTRTGCPIQTFLAWRVFRLSKSRYIFALLIFLTVANHPRFWVTAVSENLDGERFLRTPNFDGMLRITGFGIAKPRPPAFRFLSDIHVDTK